MDKLRKENEKLRTDLQATKEEVEKLSKLVTYKSQDGASSALSPERFLKYFEQTLEKFISTGKNVCVMGDFNLCLLKSEVSEFSHNFLLSLQSCYLIPTIDKPSRVICK